LLLGLVPCLIVMLRGSVVEALVGLQMAGVLETVVLLLLAEGFHRPPLFDLALVLALLTLAGGLVFARMLERWV
jgi:multisubunit Na+/H+ antiporter MnhF subunit